jgi:uncharacterized membrane protein
MFEDRECMMTDDPLGSAKGMAWGLLLGLIIWLAAIDLVLWWRS